MSPASTPSGLLKPVRFDRLHSRAPSVIKTNGPNVNMTLNEIYLNFRTAPVGSLGPAAAAYETTVYASRHLGVAYGAGYTIGTGISLLLQNFAPSVHMAIGGIVYGAVESLVNVFTSGNIGDTGKVQEEVSWNFALGNISPILASTGGDYAVVAEWNANAGGGGCGGDPDGCPILL